MSIEDSDGLIPPHFATIDHKLALVNGGNDSHRNLVLVHFGCNVFKGQKSLSELPTPYGDLPVDFVAPDAKSYRISECGKFFIQKIKTMDGYSYAVWEYKQVMYGLGSFDEAVDAIKSRQWDVQKGLFQTGSPTNGQMNSALVSIPGDEEKTQRAE